MSFSGSGRGEEGSQQAAAPKRPKLCDRCTRVSSGGVRCRPVPSVTATARARRSWLAALSSAGNQRFVCSRRGGAPARRTAGAGAGELPGSPKPVTSPSALTWRVAPHGGEAAACRVNLRNSWTTGTKDRKCPGGRKRGQRIPDSKPPRF